MGVNTTSPRRSVARYLSNCRGKIELLATLILATAFSLLMARNAVANSELTGFLPTPITQASPLGPVDLYVNKYFAFTSPLLAIAGGNSTYALGIGNSYGAAQGVWVTDTLPSDFNVLRWWSSGPHVYTSVQTGNLLAFSPLSPPTHYGGYDTIYIQGYYPPSTITRTTRITNVVTVSADNPELNMTNNTAQTGLDVYPRNSLSRGGPDAAGYIYRDSFVPDGPAYSFEDISSTGTPVSFTSPNYGYAGPFDIGFNLPFYDRSFTRFYLSPNGYVTFGGGYYSSWMPNAYGVGAYVAEQYVTPGTTGVFYQLLANPTRLVILYKDLDSYRHRGLLLKTFEIALYPEGKIELRYQQTGGLVTWVGVRSSSGTKVNYPLGGLQDGLAVAFYPTVRVLSDVDVSGPARILMNSSYPFESTINPINATPPITYTWQASSQADVVHSGVWSITDTTAFTWTTPGPQTITVTASNAWGSVSKSYTVQGEWKLFLPIIQQSAREQ